MGLGWFMDYLVTWSIDIEAENPQDAARQALAIQRRVGSSAVVFDVQVEQRRGPYQEPVKIDLEQDQYCCADLECRRVQNEDDLDEGKCCECGGVVAVMGEPRLKLVESEYDIPY